MEVTKERSVTMSNVGRTSRRLILARLGTAGAGALTIGACGQAGQAVPAAPALDTSKQADIRLATRAGQVDSKLWQDLVADFNGRQKNVKVANEEYPSAEFAAKILALSASGSQPDVMQSSDEPFFEFADKGIWLDLDPFVSRDRRALNTDDF